MTEGQKTKIKTNKILKPRLNLPFPEVLTQNKPSIMKTSIMINIYIYIYMKVHACKHAYIDVHIYIYNYKRMSIYILDTFTLLKNKILTL